MIYMFGKQPGSQAPSGFDLDRAPSGDLYHDLYHAFFA